MVFGFNMKFLRFFAMACLLTWVNGQALAQEDQKPDWKKLHYLSEEEMLSGHCSSIYQETDPLSGD